MTITYPYWNNDEVISSDKLNSMVQAIINGDPLAVKVSNATKNDVNQIVSYLSSLHNSAKTNLNSATSTSDFDNAYTNMTALVSNKLGAYANDDTVDLYSTGIRASIIAFLQAYDNMMSNDRLNNKNTDNTLGGRIDSEAHDRENADNAINNKISDMQANGGGRNLLRGTRDWQGNWTNLPLWQVNEETYKGLTVRSFPSSRWSLGQYYDAKPNTTYTFSFYAKASEAGNIMDIFALDSEDWSSPVVSPPVFANQTITTEWQRYSVTFTTKSGGKIMPSVCLTKNNITIYVAGYMLERGTVAHDWSPAPEDIDAKIAVLDDKAMKDRGTADAPDFNSLTQAGYYTITNINRGNNYPTSSLGTLEVSGQVTDANGHLNQKYVSDNGGTIYTRQYNNNTKTWTAWVKIANQYDIDSVRDLANSKANSSDVNWNLVANNSSNTYNYAHGSKIILPNNSSITINENNNMTSHIYLPMYFTDYTPNTDLDTLATSGECDNLFITSVSMATLSNRPTNPDTGTSLTGDCFFTNHYAYSGTTVRAFQKIYSCDYNYVFIRSYNGSSQSWTNWSCLTPYA